ncbi:kinase [Candidatus Colwellia aromaticivorans]|uniref:kinase n=1 Tax=Candidatus Colwellia aromaticivorans TaxID=2267621 RepID=UPI000DF2A67D|nr:kinase [Candidatus Colwellia aromaticivorans]
MLLNFIQKHSLTKSFCDTANDYYIPLANKLAKDYLQLNRQHKSTFFVGINGCQGSGKSTLAEFLADYLNKTFNLSVVVLSLDDFYFGKLQRQQLAQQYHPLFKIRGVPGTHDVNSLKSVLAQLKNSKNTNKAICLPQFDKAQDNPLPMKNGLTVTSGVDIVLFEGWCWGIPAENSNDLNLPINALEAQFDQQGIWRRQVNYSLEHDYQPLYSFMDIWLMLKAPSFDVVFQWRLEQEQKLAKANINNGSANGVMTTSEVNEFILFFQRLTIHGLNVLPTTVDILFELGSNREIIASRGID